MPYPYINHNINLSSPYIHHKMNISSPNTHVYIYIYINIYIYTYTYQHTFTSDFRPKKACCFCFKPQGRANSLDLLQTFERLPMPLLRPLDVTAQLRVQRCARGGRQWEIHADWMGEVNHLKWAIFNGFSMDLQWIFNGFMDLYGC